MTATTVKFLELREDEGKHLEEKLFILKVDEKLQFRLAPSLTSQNIEVKCNYPPERYSFKRNKYHKLQWKCKDGNQYHPDRYAEIYIEKPGSFHFRFWDTDDHDRSFLGSGYFVVEPELKHNPMDGITCITHITKLLGPLTEWEGRLKITKEASYNMIHFTPVQQLGKSGSAFSISKHLTLCDQYLPADYQPKTITAKPYEGPEFKVDEAFKKVQKLVDYMSKEWHVNSITDVVWNNTSVDSPWLPDHSEAAYNLANSPHLRPAYALDAILKKFSDDKVEGEKGKNIVTSQHDIEMIKSDLLHNVLPAAKLWEYYCIDVDAIAKEFQEKFRELLDKETTRPGIENLTIIQDPEYRRLGSSIDYDVALSIFNCPCEKMVDPKEHVERCCDQLSSHLKKLNYDQQQFIEGCLRQAVDSLADHLRYEFLEPQGPGRQDITKENPLFPRYFYVLDGDDLTTDEIKGPRSRNVVAHDGWVMDDPLENFVDQKSMVYFTRKLVVWEDLVKLRYGERRDDSPFIWNLMENYTKINAWVFRGFRIPTCHSIPIVVTEALLDVARQVRPNLYVVVELYSRKEVMEKSENYFVNRLGINAIIKEAMSTTDMRELSYIVHSYGGKDVGSFIEPTVSPLKKCRAHAMFVDATHDNDPGHIKKRCVWDVLPNTALVAVAGCASGSCRGYDELVPHKIDVVKESRLYAKWSENKEDKHVHRNCGIVAVKTKLNELHKEWAKSRYTQIYADVKSDDITAVTRFCPKLQKSIIMVAHTAFHTPHHDAIPTSSNRHPNLGQIPYINVSGVVDEIIFEAKLYRDDTEPDEQVKSDDVIEGLHGYSLDMQCHIPVEKSKQCRFIGNNKQTLELHHFSVGSVMVLRVCMHTEAMSACQQLYGFTNQSLTDPAFQIFYDLGGFLFEQLKDYIKSLSLADLNYILYRCHEEEDVSSSGAYEVPGCGRLVYCGLQGIHSILEAVRDSNDLGHPLCHNLRQGNWLIDYIINRLKEQSTTVKLAYLVDQIMKPITKLPDNLKPCYFDAVIAKIYHELISTTISHMGKFVNNGSTVVKDLALGYVQLFSPCKNADLSLHDYSSGDCPTPSLAKGLPHFCTGKMRCWGRDTFIALRGLMLVTEQYECARDCLVAYGGCVRHGLIPNLLAGGESARYNCRDAVWWWLQSLKEYVTMAPKGKEILKDQLNRMYPKDDSLISDESIVKQSLSEVVQEVLQRHYDGISFQERGAGDVLDSYMSSEGFNVTAGICKETGFVFGGNASNCGTWMNKMGESTMAGNKKKPATPRDGSAVELVGLCYSVISWLSKPELSSYPYTGVSSNDGKIFKYTDWANMIKESFENHFYIPVDRAEAKRKEGTLSHFINKTGIYKDSVGASHGYPDYQLRPNFTIAMAVAPELFNAQHAWQALAITESKLLGPIGMATLDPDDKNYKGYYEYLNDSVDYNTAKGFNYHQGPEWLWIVGYFLRAKLIFAKLLDRKEYTKQAIALCNKMVASHAAVLRKSLWKGLPELTNANGSPCPHSCEVHAVSMATMLDVLYDLKQQIAAD